MIVTGVDPGARWTGVVVRDGDLLVRHELIGSAGLSTARYLAAVIDAMEFFPGWVAVEDLVEPTPHMGMTSVAGLIGTAQVIGAVLAIRDDAVLVAPGGHGATPDLSPGPVLDACMAEQYPAGLIGTRERGAYQGRLRHCRSAWDVAGAALVQLRREEV